MLSGMPERGDLLGEVMLETGTTQSGLSRLSGVRQPSISQFLSGRVDLSDDQLDRLLSCMGYRLEVVRRPVVPELTRSERRSWRLHRQPPAASRQTASNGGIPPSSIICCSGSAAMSPASRTAATSTSGTRSSSTVTCSGCTAS